MTVHFHKEGEGHLPGCPEASSFFPKGCPRCQRNAYGVAFALSLLAALIEWQGSRQSGSLALYADAVHVLADGIGYLMGLLMMLYAGTRRSEALFLMAIVSILIWNAISILSDSILRYSQEQSLLRDGFLGAALFGLFVNGFVFWLLGRVKVSHHGHSHGGENAIKSAQASMLDANIIHTLGDMFSSLAVVAIGGMLWLWPDDVWIKALDPLTAIIIAFLLLWQAYTVILSMLRR